jgi:very-short-patch-repair endonuclease
MLGLKFRRQQPVGPYVVDFVCMSRRLAMEVDGSQHSPEVDRERDAFLADHGFKVLRFWHHDVLGRTPAVLESIRTEVPSPARGRGAGVRA